MAFQDRFFWVWPTITDAASAKRASVLGLVACAFCAGITILTVVLNFFNIEGPIRFHMLDLLDALLFIIIGWGIHRMSRIAAMAGLALYLVERIVMWSQPGHSRLYVLAIILTLMFVNSVRATFAYHRYSREEGKTVRAKETDLGSQEQPASDLPTDK